MATAQPPGERQTPPRKSKDELELDLLEEQVKNARAERLKLVAEDRKARRDDKALVRALPALSVIASILLAALGLHFTRQRDLREESARVRAEARADRENDLKRWQTRHGSFEILREDWFPTALGDAAPEPCAQARLPRDRTCSDHKGVLCSSRFNNTVFRRYRCWQPLPSGVRFSDENARSFTVALTAFDFDVQPGADGWVRNPRIQLYVKDASDDGFEIDAHIWNNTAPWMIGVTWTATGRID